MAKEWIAVDLDGTLATRVTNGIGAPISAMWDRVRRWRAQGFEVRIFTVRAHTAVGAAAVKKWLSDNDLPQLEVTNVKAPGLIALWDDKAVRVQPDTGRVCGACNASENVFRSYQADC
ncbi:hypothetical protein [Melaminivora sp.]|uniref:hypothetical protein n=1 Tax=Melaminivora sp. TaxID=1933032 RepID=UPI0028A9F49B|nr:hypothetical protein [Melaminivora sp.]